MSSQFMEYEILGRLAFMDDVNEDIVNLKIAVNGKVKGEDICSWYRISAYKHTARYLRQYANKGDMLLIKGSGYQKTYRNKDGQEVTGMQYSANRVTITRKSEKSGQSEQSSFSGQSQQSNSWSGGQSQNTVPQTQSASSGWSSSGPSQPAPAGGNQGGWGNKGGQGDLSSGGNQGGWGNGGNSGNNDPIPF